jgi:hypothetical protein
VGLFVPKSRKSSGRQCRRRACGPAARAAARARGARGGGGSGGAAAASPRAKVERLLGPLPHEQPHAPEAQRMRGDEHLQRRARRWGEVVRWRQAKQSVLPASNSPSNACKGRAAARHAAGGSTTHPSPHPPWSSGRASGGSGWPRGTAAPRPAAGRSRGRRGRTAPGGWGTGGPGEWVWGMERVGGVGGWEEGRGLSQGVRESSRAHCPGGRLRPSRCPTTPLCPPPLRTPKPMAVSSASIAHLGLWLSRASRSVRE